MSIYRGFSTIGTVKKFSLTDAELIKRDLANHFNIRKGEKLMQPEFGTIIWNLLFEPLTNDLKNSIVADITQIINYDPRVNVTDVQVTQQDHGIQILISMVYVNTNQADTLFLNFDSQSQKLHYA